MDDLNDFWLPETPDQPLGKERPTSNPRQPTTRESKRIPWYNGRFLMAPVPWIFLAARALDSAAEMAVVLAILDKACGRPHEIQLTAEFLAVYRIHPKTRNRALKRLEAAGLARVERRGREAPTVTLLLNQTWPALPGELETQLAALRKEYARWWPRDLLAALVRPGPAYAGDWPTTPAGLVRILRDARPWTVTRLQGRRVIDLAAKPPKGESL
jgi:hypothetical protein